MVMSVIGIIFALPIFQNMYVADWWHPNFIFDSAYIKIEDLIFGFSLLGIISSVYSILKSKDLKLSDSKSFTLVQKVIVIIVVFSIFLGLFYIFNLNSFWSSIVGASLGALVIFIKKPRFLKHAVITGIFVLIIFIPVYMLSLYINPNFINNEWMLNKLSGIMFLHIPIEEYIWYFFAGLGISALQEGLE